MAGFRGSKDNVAGVSLLVLARREASRYRHTGGAEHQHLRTVTLVSPVESHQEWPVSITGAVGTWGSLVSLVPPSAHHIATSLGAAGILLLTSIIEPGLWIVALLVSPLFSYFRLLGHELGGYRNGNRVSTLRGS